MLFLWRLMFQPCVREIQPWCCLSRWFVVLTLCEYSAIDKWVVSTLGYYRAARDVPAPSFGAHTCMCLSGGYPGTELRGHRARVPTHSAQGVTQPVFQRGCAVHPLAGSVRAFQLPCVPVGTWWCLPFHCSHPGDCDFILLFPMTSTAGHLFVFPDHVNPLGTNMFLFPLRSSLS